VWANASSALRPLTYSSAVRPARYVAMPSIAYRLARVAAGDGVAAMTSHGVNEYDIAAGAALVRAAGGVLLDAAGEALVLKGDAARRVTGCFAGAPQAAAALARFDWKGLDAEPRRARRVADGVAGRVDEARLARAAGCLLGQVIGDSLGAQVEFKSAAEIARQFPGGVRDLGDGGVFNTMAGQPTDDSEMALALARSLVSQGKFLPEKVLDAYREWLQTRPVDIGMTTERGLLGLHTTESESNGSLMRISPLGIWAAGDPGRAAEAARRDSALTHPNPVCLEACAGYAAAIAAGVGGAGREAMLDAALGHCAGRARAAIEAGFRGARPQSYEKNIGWVLIALQNAFFQLGTHGLEAALVDTVARGGDTDTNAAIAGALLGACHGREAIPARWILPVLSCRPLAEAGALRPRPMAFWPDDLLELAGALLALN
jgi:ADP-ribosylglycohydrolase